MNATIGVASQPVQFKSIPSRPQAPDRSEQLDGPASQVEVYSPTQPHALGQSDPLETLPTPATDPKTTSSRTAAGASFPVRIDGYNVANFFASQTNDPKCSVFAHEDAQKSVFGGVSIEDVMLNYNLMPLHIDRLPKGLEYTSDHDPLPQPSCTLVDQPAMPIRTGLK